MKPDTKVNSKNLPANFLGAAVSGILGASLLMASSASSAADGAAAKGGTTNGGDISGHCWGANSCKGKSQCVVTGKHYCMGQNTCKGKGWIESTKAKCDELAKKNKKIRFEPDGSSSS